MGGFNYGGGKGDGTNWSSERGTSPEPGGGSKGTGGRTSTSGGSTKEKTSGWAEPGPINVAVIDAAVLEALRHGLPTGTVEATQTPAYKVMRAAFDALPVEKQPAARVQTNKAWQNAHDAMPDKVTTRRETGGSKNNRTIVTTHDNEAKKTQAKAVVQVNADLESAVKQNQESERQRQVEAARKTEEARKAEEARKTEEARKAAEAKAKADAEAKRKADETKKEQEEAVKEAVKFTADFYKEVFKVYGEKAEQLAKGLANQAKGKKIRNVDDALKAYDKYKANINKKINAKDREAIAKALESVDVGKAARNIAKFSKGFGYVGPAIDVVDWITELIKAVKTDNWRSLYVKTETIAIGLAATHVTALAFGAILGGPVGILGYGLIMAGVGALVNETIVDEANKVIGI